MADNAFLQAHSGLIGGRRHDRQWPEMEAAMFMRQHEYEELRDVVVDVMLDAPKNGVNQFMSLLEQVGLVLRRREKAAPLPTGSSYPGTASQLHLEDQSLVLEIVWDLFRQGIITLGVSSSNAGWPWIKLSRFGETSLREGGEHRFHDTHDYLKRVRSEVPDISEDAAIYLEESAASFYSGCHLACCVMLGVAAEAEFLRLIDVASKNAPHGHLFTAVHKETVIRQKINKFRVAIEPILKTIPWKDRENIDTNLLAIQTIIRVARNDAGHPTGATAPKREQVYVNLQLFIPYAKQLMVLRRALSS